MKYDKYHIGHTKRGWYVACLINDPTGAKEFLPADYLWSNGEVRSFAGDQGYYQTEKLAQAAIYSIPGNILPEELFDI